MLWRWLHPALVRWLGVVAPGGGDDVESEVWISVIRGLDSFDGGEREFRAWIFTVARRRAIDWARRRRATQSLDGVELATLTDASEGLWAATSVETAVALLATLKPDQAEVVGLRVLAGFTVTETAVVVGKSEAAVRILCHRGLRALARRVSVDVSENV